MLRTVFLTSIAILIRSISPVLAGENKLESWYSYWGIGWGGHSYSDASFDALQNQQGIDHAELGLDLLGFYWPIGENTIIGGILNGTGDGYSAGSLKTTITTSLLSFSTMRFVSNRIGQGPFIRGDIGLAQLNVKTEAGNLGTSEASDAGFGFLLGGGYGLPVTPGTRLLFNINYSIRRIQGENFKIIQISLGGLF